MNATTRHRLDGIEVCRGVAATSVVFYHAARHLDKTAGAPDLTGLTRFGHAGVDLFFVISGFIILFVHYDDVGRPRRLAHYARRRLTRVMPTYWVALALTVMLGLAGGHGLPSGADLTWSALLLPSHAEPVLGVAWTLMYESVFYAVFGVLIVNRITGLAVFALWFGWIVSATLAPVGLGLPPSLYGVYNLEFFLGMAAAFWLKTRVLPAPGRILAVGTAAFATMAVAEDAGLLDGYAGYGRLAYGVPAALIVIAAADASRRTAIGAPAALRRLGAASYSIYLFQFVFIGILWQLMLGSGLDRQLPRAVMVCLLAVGGVTGGVVMCRLVEYPLTRLARRRRNLPHMAVG